MNRRQFIRNSSLAGTVSAFAPSLIVRSGRSDRSSSAFQAGYFETDITPAIGMERSGGYIKRYHESFHDPCKVRAAVFDAGIKVAFVSVDALIVPRDVVVRAREGIESLCGIQSENVLIAATHSHSSGPVAMVQPGQYDHASEFVQFLAYEKSSNANAEYLEHIERQIIAAVCQADHLRADATSGVGWGREEEAAYNRRYRMQNGQTWTNPGKRNPDTIEAAGPIDPEVGVIGTWDKTGNLLGCIVTYACHASINPGAISANWIYYLEQTIRGGLGADVPVLFFAAPSGDINTINSMSPYVQPGGDEASRLLGGRVGAETVKVLLNMERGSLTPLDSKVTTLRFDRRVPRPERVREAYELAKSDAKVIGMTEWTFAKETVLLDALLRKEPVADVEIQALQVGPAVFVTTPAEYFVEYGLEIKAKSPFPFTFPISLANGSVGYVPTEEAFGSKGGGYETRLTSYSNLDVSAGRRMADAGLELANRLSPGEMPVPPLAPEGKPWPYGNVPPNTGH